MPQSPPKRRPPWGRLKIPLAQVIISTQTGFPDAVQCHETAYGELELVFLIKNVPVARIAMSDEIAGSLASQIEFYLQDKVEAKRVADQVEARMGADQGRPSATSESGASGKVG